MQPANCRSIVNHLLMSKYKWRIKSKLFSSISSSKSPPSLMSRVITKTSTTPAIINSNYNGNRSFCTTLGTYRMSSNMEDSGGQQMLPLDRFRRDHIDNLRKKIEIVASKTPHEQDITLEKDDQSKLAMICVRSGAKNALSGRMISRLTEVLDELYEWREGKGVLLHGFNGTFCSGSDLVSVRATANQEAGLEIAQIMQYNLMRLQQLPMVSVAFVEGYALGGGAELATGADLRIMSSSAKIGFVHINMGVCCGWGGGSRLVQLLGPSRALDLLSSGRLVGAQEAQQLGLSNATIELGEGEHGKPALEMAMDFLGSHTVGAKETYAALKTMLNSARTLPLCDSLKLEAQLFASTWGTAPHIRALDGNLKHNNLNLNSNKNSKWSNINNKDSLV